MKNTLRDRIDELAAMDVKALQAEYEKLFGQPAVSTHRQYLFRKIAWQVQAEAHGGLPEAAVEIARGIAVDVSRAGCSGAQLSVCSREYERVAAQLGGGQSPAGRKARVPLIALRWVGQGLRAPRQAA